jgi:lipoprotein-anchoring transpeptidase ErfK/SrfK
VGLAFLAANTLFAAAYLDRIYPGVELSGTDLSGMTRQQAKQILGKQLASYKLRVEAEGRQYDLGPQQLGVDYSLDTTVAVAFGKGRGKLVPIWGLWESLNARDLRHAFSVDRSKLIALVAQVAGQSTVLPRDATIEIKEGKLSVRPDESGVGIDQAKLISLIEEAVMAQEEAVKVGLAALPAEINASDVTANLEEAQRFLAADLELSYGAKVFRPDARVIGGWIAFPKEQGRLKTVVDEAKVRDYIKTLARSIDLAPKNHLINVLNGAVQGEEPGKEGLAVDQAVFASQLIEALNTGSGKLVIPVKTLPFKTVYNRSINLDYGRYIEVNLSLQRLWAYEDHKVAFETPITSGAAGAGFPTVTGLFDVYSKARNRYLNGYSLGYDYNVFVQYWMPFHRDYGLHDASWRSSFGGPDYYYGGSHGCVNMPVEAAAWLYGWADVGTPVWVHT